jgi:hypothetical protein
MNKEGVQTSPGRPLRFPRTPPLDFYVPNLLAS